MIGPCRQGANTFVERHQRLLNHPVTRLSGIRRADPDSQLRQEKSDPPKNFRSRSSAARAPACCPAERSYYVTYLDYLFALTESRQNKADNVALKPALRSD